MGLVGFSLEVDISGSQFCLEGFGLGSKESGVWETLNSKP